MNKFARTAAIYFGILLVYAGRVLAAPECYPADAFFGQLGQKGYKQHLLLAKLGIDPRTDKALRESLELSAKAAINADDLAQRAIQDGTIQPGDRQEFINTTRRLAYLKLKENSALVFALMVMYRADDRKGLVAQRQMVFPDEGRQGAKLASTGEVCIQTRLVDIVVNPTGEVSPESLLPQRESADCASLSDAAMPCAKLSEQLLAARNSGERVLLTAKQAEMNGIATSVSFILTSNRRGGRTLSSSSQGTTILTNYFFASGL